MKICIVGDNSYPLDEGMKKTTASIVNVVSNHFKTMVLNPLKVLSPGFWVSLIRFKPDIIHYVPGPSLLSFILLHVMRLLTSSKTVMSVTHPDPDLHAGIARLFKPDLILTQSKRTEEIFRDLGKQHSFLPNGVDTERFRPVSILEKKRLRQKYGIAEEAFVVLHVGNTRTIRNLDILQDLNGENVQVVVVSSTTIRGNDKVNERLRSYGCIVIDYFVKCVEEIYQLADFYIFPTVNHEGAIEHPLSVMEAMACNLYVATTKFGALNEMFQEGEGFFFCQSRKDFEQAITASYRQKVLSETRTKVLMFSWDAIGNSLDTHYQKLAIEGRGVIH